MPVAKVCTPKWATVPKSAMVSISARMTPPAMAGRAIGSEMRQNEDQGVWPSVRAAK